MREYVFYYNYLGYLKDGEFCQLHNDIPLCVIDRRRLVKVEPLYAVIIEDIVQSGLIIYDASVALDSIRNLYINIEICETIIKLSSSDIKLTAYHRKDGANSPWTVRIERVIEYTNYTNITEHLQCLKNILTTAP